ncbi:HtaA domain-containing protein [Micromonospora sp. NPDC052213]|uniref:HtaA domain-containing protein n=1 Tax=Micromonospora sp. NPDC052213 TaxID=3155812 RepID=UPI0034141EA9
MGRPLDSFVNYVRAVDGSVTVIAPSTATVDGRFRFPILTVDGDTATFGGGARLVAHGGALTLEIEEPWVAATPALRHAVAVLADIPGYSRTRALSVLGTRATNSDGGRLVFADVFSDTPAPGAVVAFDFRYPYGTALAAVDFAASE